MPARTVRFLVVCTGVCFVSVPLGRGQEATSANLPDQFQTGEMIQIQKPKKKKSESTSKAVAEALKQATAPVPEQTPVPEEMPTLIAPVEEKKAETNRSTASIPPSGKPAAPDEQSASTEESAPVVVKRKPRPRKRARPTVQPAPSETASISTSIPMSLSVAQSMAISAPLPEYTYEMKRRNLTGSGTCVVIVDTATGTVTSATMFQSTGSPLLDKLTTQTFKSWRFKPGTVSQVRIPVTFE